MHEVRVETRAWSLGRRGVGCEDLGLRMQARVQGDTLDLRRVVGGRRNLEQREGIVETLALDSNPAVLPAQDLAPWHPLVEPEKIASRANDVKAGRRCDGVRVRRPLEEGRDVCGRGVAEGQMEGEQIFVEEAEGGGRGLQRRG